jgi:hypothetical protein
MSASETPITPESIKAKMGELQGEVETQAEAAKGMAVAVGAAVVVGVVLAVFVLGLRRGKKRTTVVEIRRV